MLRQLSLTLRVENILNKMANLMFALRYFDISGFLEVVKNHLGEFYFQAQEKITLLANIDYIVDNVIQLTFQSCEVFVTFSSH